MRTAKFFALALLAAVPAAVSAQQPGVELHGAGWVQAGKVYHSTNWIDNNFLDYNNNVMQNAGALLGVTYRVDDKLEVAAGLGAIQVHLIRGTQGNGNWYPFVVPFVSEARATFTQPSLFTEGDKFQFTVGNFPYGYNPDAKNLGVYLMKGYVYPGTLVSGFGNVFGAMGRYRLGGFQNDLILNAETEDKPFYDYSVADVVSYEILPGLEVGAGVNLYRLIAQDSKITNPGKDCQPNDLGPRANGGCFIVDTAGVGAGGQPDTITGGLSGTKLMGRLHADPKKMFDFSHVGGLKLGAADLILYGEVAVLGLQDYAVYYEDIARRIPVMVGFNFPAFTYLDNLSLEVEYYASKNSSDNLRAQNGSWVPQQNTAVNHARDDWKWSVAAGKMLWSNMKLTAMVANDHLRLGGTHDGPSGVEALTTPDDWYWTCKLAYFF